MTDKICRFCRSSLSEIFADLGISPLANSFLKSNELEKKERKYPLIAYLCSKCFLVQIPEFERPENIFTDYAYFSSFSNTWLKHSEDYVNLIIKEFSFNDKSFVVEIASNDGYLLQYFKDRNIPILGIEPASNVAKIAQERGIPTLVKFFGTDTATYITSRNQKADLIIANNVLAHVPDLNDFVSGMKQLLKEDGIITIEFPHLLNLIRFNQFDTIYHEHFSYFSLLILEKIFSSHGLIIFHVEEIPTHGGSLRVYIKHSDNKRFSIRESVNIVMNNEKKHGLDVIATYSSFAKRIGCIKEDIRVFFYNAKKKNKKIVCYGAAAKGNTLLNYCEISKEFIEYVVDKNHHKQGLFLPGTHIQIMDPSMVFESKPDYLVILPWNLKDEVMQQMNRIRDWNGKFVTLIPKVEIY